MGWQGGPGCSAHEGWEAMSRDLEEGLSSDPGAQVIAMCLPALLGGWWC